MQRARDLERCSRGFLWPELLQMNVRPNQTRRIGQNVTYPITSLMAERYLHPYYTVMYSLKLNSDVPFLDSPSYNPPPD